jgi:hypothetical protein
MTGLPWARDEERGETMGREQSDDHQAAMTDGARIHDDELTDAGPPLPGEGRDDPLTRDEATALEKGVDPDSGLAAGREALR